MVAQADADMLIDIPAAGTPERAALVRAMAARMWAGRETDWPFDEAGEYWQSTFITLAEDALRELDQT